ncbi:hypothetical protein FWK35_00030928 [Aphis craccivora]|uniref:Uncharacterized protein n=1 Tax=Aphis craccivora TaxID=307492 RepID=A0A6G0YL01_APHCR|nr:hypothetical protein FWK35_00030928 [Aphis craccivora]
MCTVVLLSIIIQFVSSALSLMFVARLHDVLSTLMNDNNNNNNIMCHPKRLVCLYALLYLYSALFHVLRSSLNILRPLFPEKFKYVQREPPTHDTLRIILNGSQSINQ